MSEIANQDKDELAIGASAPPFSELVHILLWNQIGKRSVSENHNPAHCAQVSRYAPQQTLLHLVSISHELAICLLRSIHRTTIGADSMMVASRVGQPTASAIEIATNE